jgi:DNA polymerase II large subunit
VKDGEMVEKWRETPQNKSKNMGFQTKHAKTMGSSSEKVGEQSGSMIKDA